MQKRTSVRNRTRVGCVYGMHFNHSTTCAPKRVLCLPDHSLAVVGSRAGIEAHNCHLRMSSVEGGWRTSVYTDKINSLCLVVLSAGQN